MLYSPSASSSSWDPLLSTVQGFNITCDGLLLNLVHCKKNFFLRAFVKVLTLGRAATLNPNTVVYIILNKKSSLSFRSLLFSWCRTMFGLVVHFTTNLITHGFFKIYLFYLFICLYFLMYIYWFTFLSIGQSFYYARRKLQTAWLRSSKHSASNLQPAAEQKTAFFALDEAQPQFNANGVLEVLNLCSYSVFYKSFIC